MHVIQDFHMDDRGWWDIGYNFLIGQDGRIYEGRGFSVQGAHCSGWNTQTLGSVIFIGCLKFKILFRIFGYGKLYGNITNASSS